MFVNKNCPYCVSNGLFKLNPRIRRYFHLVWNVSICHSKAFKNGCIWLKTSCFNYVSTYLLKIDFNQTFGVIMYVCSNVWMNNSELIFAMLLNEQGFILFYGKISLEFFPFFRNEFIIIRCIMDCFYHTSIVNGTD